MNATAQSRFRVIPVMLSSWVATPLATMIMTPTSGFQSWIMGAGIAMIPMIFILIYGIQCVRRRQVAYSLPRAVLLGGSIGFLSVILIRMIDWVIIPLFFWLYQFV